MFVFLSGVLHDASAEVIVVGVPGLEMYEDAIEFLAISAGLGDEVDVVDFADTEFTEDGGNAAILDVGEDTGDAEGRLMGQELFRNRDTNDRGVLGGGVVLGRSGRRILSGHVSRRSADY